MRIGTAGRSGFAVVMPKATTTSVVIRLTLAYMLLCATLFSTEASEKNAPTKLPTGLARKQNKIVLKQGFEWELKDDQIIGVKRTADMRISSVGVVCNCKSSSSKGACSPKLIPQPDKKKADLV